MWVEMPRIVAFDHRQPKTAGIHLAQNDIFIDPLNRRSFALEID
jgi:hypothetical protein